MQSNITQARSVVLAILLQGRHVAALLAIQEDYPKPLIQAQVNLK